MALETTVNRVTYAGNGSTTAFSFPYYFLAQGDLVVIVTTAAGVATTQTIATQYTVSGVGVAAGGTVTMVTAPASGETLTIYRDPGLTQGVDLIENDSLPAETLEQALDRLTMITQRLKDRVDRSIILADGFVDSFTLTLPSDLATAGYYLQVNAAGNGFDVVAGLTDTISVPAGSGILAKVSSAATAARTITATANETSVADGDGVSGNPTIGIADNPVLPGTAGVVVNTGTTAQRAVSPTAGTLRYNSTLSQLESYTGSSPAWKNVSTDAPTVQKFTTGSGTYTTPTGVKWIRVRMAGGGGGGAGSGTSGGTVAGDGGTSTFGSSLLEATGGSKGLYNNTISIGGTASLGSGPVGLAFTGTSGGGNQYTPTSGPGLTGGPGGNSAMFGGGQGGAAYNAAGGAGVANTGGGGSGGGAGPSGVGNVHIGGGGAGGGSLDAIITGPAASYAYAVGAGGTAGGAGANGVAGGAGAAGIIIVEEHY